MVTVTIGKKTLEIEYSKDLKTIIRDFQPVSDDELKEFEEEILKKDITKASEEEINKAIEKMAKELDCWLNGQDKWMNWKIWTAGL